MLGSNPEPHIYCEAVILFHNSAISTINKNNEIGYSWVFEDLIQSILSYNRKSLKHSKSYEEELTLSFRRISYVVTNTLNFKRLLPG